MILCECSESSLSTLLSMAAPLLVTQSKSPLLYSARDDGDSSRYHPIYLRNTKRGGTKGRILRGTTLIHLHQINSRLLNASHPGKTYFDFSHAVPERTSLFPIYRFPAFPALCEKSEIRTFFHQHFCNMCLLYRMMRKMSSRKASINQERRSGAIQRRRSAKGIPAADLLSPP